MTTPHLFLLECTQEATKSSCPKLLSRPSKFPARFDYRVARISLLPQDLLILSGSLEVASFVPCFIALIEY